MKQAAFLFLALAAAACSQQPGETVTPTAGCGEGATGIVVSDAWVRAADASRPATAAYLTLCNAGAEADALIGVAAPSARAVELHETTRSADGVVKMSPVEKLDLAPSTPAALAPGGAHIMLIGLTEALEAGATATITLEFENSAPMTIEAPIRDAAPGSGEHH